PSPRGGRRAPAGPHGGPSSTSSRKPASTPATPTSSARRSTARRRWVSRAPSGRACSVARRTRCARATRNRRAPPGGTARTAPRAGGRHAGPAGPAGAVGQHARELAAASAHPEARRGGEPVRRGEADLAAVQQLQGLVVRQRAFRGDPAGLLERVATVVAEAE